MSAALLESPGAGARAVAIADSGRLASTHGRPRSAARLTGDQTRHGRTPSTDPRLMNPRAIRPYRIRLRDIGHAG
jgi:hypothetical protein